MLLSPHRREHGQAERPRLRGVSGDGQSWAHLRICRTCGHVGCCDQPPNRHATAHFRATHHPIVEGYDPRRLGMVLPRRDVLGQPRSTPQLGPILRYV